MESKRELADKRLQHLKSERANIDPLWRELRDIFKPGRGRFDRDELRMHRRPSLLNSRPQLAANILPSGLHAGLTSPARPWQRSGVRDDDLAEYGPVKEWLSIVDTRMMALYARSGLYQALPFMYAEYGVFGTMAGCLYRDDKRFFRAEPYTAGQYYLARGASGEYDTLVREFTMTVRQVVSKFGEAKVSPEIRRKWANPSQREEFVEVVHMIEPDGRGQWDSCYYDAKRRDVNDGLLKRAKFRNNPIMASAWEHVGLEPYASDCPGMTARGDAKAIQIDEKNKSRAIERSHNPPMQGPIAHSGVSLTPGSYSQVDDLALQKGGIRSVYDFRADISGLRENIAERVDRVEDAFYVDLFLMLSRDDRNQRATAAEIAALHDEKLLALGPMLEQTNNMLRAIHEWVFTEMVEESKPMWLGIIDGEPILPPPPQELQDQEIEPEFISLLHQAQRAQAIQGLERFASAATAVAQLTGKVPEKFDTDQWLDEVAAATGVSPGVVRDDEEVAAMREAAAQAEQMAQMAQMAPAANQAASAVQKLAETQPAEGGIADILGGA